MLILRTCPIALSQTVSLQFQTRNSSHSEPASQRNCSSVSELCVSLPNQHGVFRCETTLACIFPDLSTSSTASVYLYSRKGYLLERYNNDVMWVYVNHPLPSAAPIVAVTALSGFPDLLFVSDAQGPVFCWCASADWSHRRRLVAGVSGKLHQRLIDDLSHPPKLTWGDVTKPGSQFVLPGINTRVCPYPALHPCDGLVDCDSCGQHGSMVFVDVKGQLAERALRSGAWRALPKTPVPTLPASHQRACVPCGGFCSPPCVTVSLEV
jgi:hypothetical protein